MSTRVFVVLARFLAATSVPVGVFASVFQVPGHIHNLCDLMGT